MLLLLLPASICLPFAPVNMKQKGHIERERERDDVKKKKQKREM